MVSPGEPCIAPLEKTKTSNNWNFYIRLRLVQTIGGARLAGHLHRALLHVVVLDRELEDGGGAAALELHVLVSIPHQGVLERSHLLPSLHILFQNLLDLNIILENNGSDYCSVQAIFPLSPYVSPSFH